MIDVEATVRYNAITNLYYADAVFQGKLFKAEARTEAKALKDLAQKIKDFRDGTVQGYPKKVKLEI